MEYTILENGKTYDLPKYNLKISAKMEVVENFKRTGASSCDKIRKMYDFIAEIIGKENAVEILGKVDDADPNYINIVYLDIVKAYNKPLTEYESERQAEQLDNDIFDKLDKLVKGVNALNTLNKSK